MPSSFLLQLFYIEHFQIETEDCWDGRNIHSIAKQ